MHAYVFNIQRFSIHDGPGIRTTVFLQGCPLQCIWCHNPEGIPQYLRNREGEYPPGIREYSPLELLDEVVKDRVFYEASGGGVTLSGGEPLMQAGFVMEMLMKLRKESLHSCIDTSGYAPNNVFREAAEQADLILFDLKFADTGRHAQYTGTDNKLILENLSQLINGQGQFRIRIPLISGINDDDDNINGIARLLEGKEGLNVDLLPYHNLGQAKWMRLSGKLAPKLKAPNAGRLREIREIFQQHGHHVVEKFP